MTRTALRALTVLGALGVTLTPAGPALASDEEDPAVTVCAAGEEFQGELLGCVAVQLPEETLGREDGDVPAPLPVPEDPCFRQDPECYEPPVLGQTVPVPPAAEPVADPAPQAAETPVALGPPQAAAPAPGDAPAPGQAPAPGGQPSWATLDLILEALHGLLPWLF